MAFCRTASKPCNLLPIGCNFCSVRMSQRQLDQGQIQMSGNFILLFSTVITLINISTAMNSYSLRYTDDFI